MNSNRFNVFFLGMYLFLSFTNHCYFVHGDKKVCAGTNLGFTRLEGGEHYRVLKNMYSGCEIVLGNLEVTFLQPNDDVSFLKSIQEVGGSVFIVGNNIKSIPLENLRLIRGNDVYSHDLALVIGSNYHDGMELPMRSLTEILNGGVEIYSNRLCNIDTIQWDDIVNTENSNNSFSSKSNRYYHCSPCDIKCDGSCWAPGPENCQTFTKKTCSMMCSHRCRGSSSSDCCDDRCASGCDGSQPEDCLACRTLNDGETCRQSCPALKIYNTAKFKIEPNANGMYRLQDHCFRVCPDGYKQVETGECVEECSPDSEEVEQNGIHLCRKRTDEVCDGIGTGKLRNAFSIRSTNIDLFQNCTKVLGNLIVLPQDKYSDRSPKSLDLDPNKLNVFKTIREITGYLLIKWWPGQYPDLSLFENLEIIHGREKKNGKYALILINLPVTSLGLRSLKEIRDGDVLVKANRNLCYVDSVKWSRLVQVPDNKVIIEDNQTPTKCNVAGHECDPLCSDEGCWGPGPFQCLSCHNFSRRRECVLSCKLYGLSKRPEYEHDGKCESCHTECKPQLNSLTCTGPGPDECTACSHYKDGPHCVKSCPSGIPDKNDNLIWKYPDELGLCQLCDTECDKGCKGPGVKNCLLVLESVNVSEE